MKYDKGDGVEQDSTKAVELYRQAHAAGHADATRNLGVMYERGDSKTPHEVTSFPMGSRRINELMTPLRDGLASELVLHERIGDARFLTTTTGDALVALTYNVPLDGADGSVTTWTSQHGVAAAEVRVDAMAAAVEAAAAQAEAARLEAAVDYEEQVAAAAAAG